jgi:hypothetical protein
MSQKNLGYILIVVGVVILLVSVFADTLGIGSSASFGWKQIAGTVIGVLVALAGGWLATRKSA